MSGNAVPTPKVDLSSGSNFVSGITGGTFSTDVEKDINYADPGIGGLATGIYNGVTKMISAPSANLQDPSTAGAPPTQGQVAQDQLGATLQTEQQQAQSSSGVFLGPEGLDEAQPRTSSQSLLGF